MRARRTYCVAMVLLLTMGKESHADLVIMDREPTFETPLGDLEGIVGIADPVNDFLGLLVNTYDNDPGPMEDTQPVINIGLGAEVVLGIELDALNPNVPDAYAIDEDVVGRHVFREPTMEGSGDGHEFYEAFWTYEIANAGGLENIAFEADLFYRPGAYTDGGAVDFFIDLFDDQGLVLSETISATVSAGEMPPVGQAAPAKDHISYAYMGAALITSVRVEGVLVDGFTGADDGFLTHGELSANAIPEPSAYLMVGVALCLSLFGKAIMTGDRLANTRNLGGL